MYRVPHMYHVSHTHISCITHIMYHTCIVYHTYIMYHTHIYHASHTHVSSSIGLYTSETVCICTPHMYHCQDSTPEIRCTPHCQDSTPQTRTVYRYMSTDLRRTDTMIHLRSTDTCIVVKTLHLWTTCMCACVIFSTARSRKDEERWGAGVETQKNVRGVFGGWGRVPFNEPYAPSLSTIYDGA